MPYAQSDGCSLYYEIHGEKGTPVLLINGYGASSAGWYRPFVETLARHHRVILFDNRGVGQSDKPNEPYTMNQFADDCAAVMDAAGEQSAHVLSVSMGGMIAQNLALRHPKRIRGLVLGCTTPAGMDCPEVCAPEPAVLETLKAPRTGDPALDIRNLWPILYSPEYIREHSDWLEEDLQRKLSYPQTPQYALDCQMQAIEQTHDVLDRLSEIRLPTLVLTGDADVLVPPENSRLIASRIPDSRLIEYPGAGHDVLEEAWEPAVDDILAFFAAVDGMR